MKQLIGLLVALSLVITPLPAAAKSKNCSKFFLQLFCKSTWKNVGHVTKMNAKTQTDLHGLCFFSFGLHKDACEDAFGYRDFNKLIKAAADHNVESWNVLGKVIKKAAKNKEVLQEVTTMMLPDEFRAEIRIDGSGIMITYNTRDNIRRVIKRLKKNPVDISMLWEILPDEVRVTWQLKLVPVLNVANRNIFIYNTREDIKRVAEIFKEQYQDIF